MSESTENPPNLPSGKRTCSYIWEHFSRTTHNTGDKIVQCNSCSNLYKNPSGTSNLWKHYKQVHQKSDASQSQLDSNGSIIQLQPLTGDKETEITQHILQFFISAGLPFKVIENDEFRKLLGLLKPRYKIITRRTLQRKIMDEYRIMRTKLREYFATLTETECSFTIDAWSSRVFRSYISVTIHFIDDHWNLQSFLLDFVRFKTLHTSENVHNLVAECLSYWGLTGNIMAITTDNGAEMKRGLSLLETALNKSDLHVRCLAHIINLAVKAGFNEIHSWIEGIRSLIAAIRVSVKRRERFLELKGVYGPPDAVVPGLDVATRWSSTYLMIDPALKAKDILNGLCSTTDGLDGFSISNSTWEYMGKFRNLLQVFHDATKNQPGVHYMTLSMTIRVYEIVCDAVDDFKETEVGPPHSIAAMMQDKLRNYSGLVQSNVTKLAKSLDQRFPNKHDADEDHMRTYMVSHGYEVQSNAVRENNNLEASSFLSNIFGTQESITGNEPGSDEVRYFFLCTRDKVQAKSDPLEWWRHNQDKFPNVSKLARKVLAIQPTSVASEPIFFRSGRLVSETRSSLSDESISAIMLLQSWQEFFQNNES